MDTTKTYQATPFKTHMIKLDDAGLQRMAEFVYEAAPGFRSIEADPLAGIYRAEGFAHGWLLGQCKEGGEEWLRLTDFMGNVHRRVFDMIAKDNKNN